MITALLVKSAKFEPMRLVSALSVSPEGGIRGGVATAMIRQVLLLPRSTLSEFGLGAGDLRENMNLDDSSVGPLHELKSGTVLAVGATVRIRLTIHCEPCVRVSKYVQSPKHLEHRRGYLGSIVSSGDITVGSPVTSLGQVFEPIPHDIKARIAWYLAQQTTPVQAARLLVDVGLSQSYCRALPRLIAAIPGARDLVVFKGQAHSRDNAARCAKLTGII